MLSAKQFLAGLASLLLCIETASALHIPVVSFVQNNWNYTLLTQPIVGENGEYGFTLTIDEQLYAAGSTGIAGSTESGLLPETENSANWYLHVGPHIVRLTYFDVGDNFIISYGAPYTVIAPTGERPATNGVPDAGYTLPLLALSAAVLIFLRQRHGRLFAQPALQRARSATPPRYKWQDNAERGPFSLR